MRVLTSRKSVSRAVARVIHAAEGALHLTDDAHGGLAIGAEADGKVLGILGSHRLADLADAGTEILWSDDGAIDLNLPLAVELAYIDIDDGGAIGQLLHFLGLGHLQAHLHLVGAHVGDNHEEEKHGEDEVGHRRHVQ